MIKELVSPIDCKHRHTDLLHGSRVISTNEHSYSNVYLCMDCGQFMIRGAMNGEYYSIDFTLVRDEHLMAASRAVRYYSQGD